MLRAYDVITRSPDVPLQVSWGGGVNSTAVLVGLAERGIRPDAVVFADTGSEKPETDAYVDVLRAYLARVGFPDLTVVKRNSKFRGYTSLEDECLKNGTIPSRAFGWGACADKWKIGPQDVWANQWEHARRARAAGLKPIKALGYDADEPHRAKRLEDDKWLFWHPLIEWDWDRDACVAAVERAGLPVPAKSACFFCPSSTKTEILWLAEHHPDLFARALAMEAAALPSLDTVKGLGRRFAWHDLVPLTTAAGRADPEARARVDALPEAPVESCTICVDDSGSCPRY